jgi:tRNA(fMet)-specific endonuclease VapC
MIWHLDTNIVVASLRGNGQVTEALASHLPNVAISTIVLGELLYGVRLSAQREENWRQLRELVSLVEVTPFDAACAETYGELRADLHRRGQVEGAVDLWIAAVAVAAGAVLVTHNVRHFKGIEQLRIEDWLL